jgi:hypothetical protein
VFGLENLHIQKNAYLFQKPGTGDATMQLDEQSQLPI